MTTTKTISAFDSVRLLAAFQVLTLPSGAMGVPHKRAKEVIVELTGMKLPKGKPPVGADLATYVAWLSPGATVHQRSAKGVTSG